MQRLLRATLCSAALSFVLATSAHAGPFILDGTDADDHGFTNGIENFDGWFYMQRALENLAPGVTNGNDVVASLGASSSALNAAQSAFDLSTLPGMGWTFTSHPNSTDITAFFATGGDAATTGIVMLPSDGVGGGLSTSDESALTAVASDINDFLGNGGALFSMGHDYGWLTALLPDVTVTRFGGDGTLELTSAGSSAFPGLTNSDLNAGPFHGEFSGDLGGISILFIDSAANAAVGIGSSGGSVTDPDPPVQVPEPGMLALLMVGLGAAGGYVARRRQ